MIAPTVISADMTIGPIISAANIPNMPIAGTFAKAMDSVTAMQTPFKPPVALGAIGAELAVNLPAAPSEPVRTHSARPMVGGMNVEIGNEGLTSKAGGWNGEQLHIIGPAGQAQAQQPVEALRPEITPMDAVGAESVTHLPAALPKPIVAQSGRPLVDGMKTEIGNERPFPKVIAGDVEQSPATVHAEQVQTPPPADALHPEIAPNVALTIVPLQEPAQRLAFAASKRLGGETRDGGYRLGVPAAKMVDVVAPMLLPARVLGAPSAETSVGRSLVPEKVKPNSPMAFQFETLAVSAAGTEPRIVADSNLTFAISNQLAPSLSSPVAAPLPVITMPDLDTGNGDAWLSQLAQDISAAQSADGNLSFRLLPRNLGQIDVAMQRGDAGLAIQIATDNEAARSMMVAAQPKLIEEMRDHGVRIVSAEVARPSVQADGGANDRQRHPREPITAFIETADRPSVNSHSQPSGRRGRFA